MHFGEESFEKAWGAALPFITAHHEEVSLYTSFKLDPDVEKYRLLSDMGIYKAFTMRTSAKSELVGYAGFFMSPMLHFKNNNQAVNDLIYVRPEYRKQGHGKAFIDYINKALKELGADIVYYNIPARMDWSKMLKERGFAINDFVYSRRI